MNASIQDLQTLCTGLQERLKTIRAQMDLFHKAKGLYEEEEKLRAEAGRIRDEIAEEKNNLAELKTKKNIAMQQSIAPMTERMNAMLPTGSAVIRIDDDGNVFIGWKNGKATVPYAGLSGGEKAAFDPALCRALGGTVLIVEAAELDKDRLTQALKKYAATDMQVIVSSCHKPKVVTEPWMDQWKVVEL